VSAAVARPLSVVQWSPHQEADALLRFATASIFLAGSAHFFFVERARG
jgi:hypothetical protein